MSKLSYNSRINLVYEFLKSKPGYYKKSAEKISELTGENNSEIIRLAKELFRNVEKFNEGWVEPYLDGDPDNVLVIGDPHEPFTKEGYLEFCRKVQEEYDCGTVIHIGDAPGVYIFKVETGNGIVTKRVIVK